MERAWWCCRWSHGAASYCVSRGSSSQGACCAGCRQHCTPACLYGPPDVRCPAAPAAALRTFDGSAIPRLNAQGCIRGSNAPVAPEVRRLNQAAHCLPACHSPPFAHHILHPKVALSAFCPGAAILDAQRRWKHPNSISRGPVQAGGSAHDSGLAGQFNGLGRALPSAF